MGMEYFVQIVVLSQDFKERGLVIPEGCGWTICLSFTAFWGTQNTQSYKN